MQHKRGRESRSAAGFGPLELTGRSRAHLAELPGLGIAVHRAVVAPFLALRREAARAGFDLAPASGFRDFDRQVRIWNAKWRGEVPLHARDGRPLVAARLAPARRVAAILVWSAPPGASRHHWGTDLDVYDRAAVPDGYRLQLVPEEYAPGGPFARLAEWLAANAWRHGFYRPYRTDRGGVQPEPWHLSHAPTAARASARLRLPTVRAALVDAPLDGRAALLAALPSIYAAYVRAVDPPPRRARATSRANSRA